MLPLSNVDRPMSIVPVLEFVDVAVELVEDELVDEDDLVVLWEVVVVKDVLDSVSAAYPETAISTITITTTAIVVVLPIAYFSLEARVESIFAFIANCGAIYKDQILGQST